MRKKSKSSVGLSFFSEKKWNDALSLILSAILIVVVARDTFRFWWWEYTAPESYYSHAFLVPLLIGFILWAHRERIAKVEFCPCYGAAIFVAAMAFVNIMAARNEMQAVMSYSLLGLLVSSACLLMGTRFVWREKVAFAFLIAMLPLPGPLLNDMTFGLQNISTAGAAWFLNHIGFDCQRTGYQLTMQNFALLVDVPCSGFKTLIAILTFNAFFAYLLDASKIKRTMLFLIAVPLAVGVNVLRIGLIGIVGECVSDHAAKVFHDYSGIITLCLGIAVLFLLARIFGCRKFAGQAIY